MRWNEKEFVCVRSATVVRGKTERASQASARCARARRHRGKTASVELRSVVFLNSTLGRGTMLDKFQKKTGKREESAKAAKLLACLAVALGVAL